MSLGDEGKVQERASFLRGLFARKHEKYAELTEKTGGMEPITRLKPSLFKKFMRLMAQIFFLQKKEAAILRELSDVEEEHKKLRDAKKLKKADPNFLIKDGPIKNPEQRETYTAWAAGLLLWMSGGKKKGQTIKAEAPSPKGK